MSPGSEQAVPQQPSTDRSASAGPDTAALRFRQDLTITQKPRGAQGKMFVVKDPRSGEHYEFDEHAFFLCQSFDGVSTPEQIVTRFNSFFGESITTEDVARFFQQALEMGLLESTGRPGRRTLPVARGDRRSAEALTDAEREDGGEADSFEDTGGKDDKYRWTLTNPSRVYALLNRITKPFRLFFLFLTYGLFVGIPLALITFLDNQYAMSQDLSQLGEPRSYLGRLVFSLLLINFGRCVVQGTVCTYYGGTVRKFGIKLRFGIIPRFFIDKSAIKKFDRNAKLWTYGSNLLFRLVLVVIGVFTWYLFRGTGTQLAVSAIIVAHAALISFILVCLPIRASDGYRWLVTFFRLPLSLIKLAIRTLVATVTRKPLPTSISDKERRRLLSYSLVLVSFWTYAFFRISSHITAGLASSFPDIFGQATEFLIGAVVVVLVLKWGFHRFSKMGATGEPSPSTSMVADDTYTGGPLTQYDATRELWQNRALKIALKIAVVVTIGVVLALPYPYRPGGEISLLPPEQQQIQAPISGKISEVLYNGGDGR
ncbi:MAG: PqqD family protein, partial [Pseudomonadota bacterium]|nr:PqqD family protein [Pseudomonadota bacterium]